MSKSKPATPPEVAVLRRMIDARMTPQEMARDILSMHNGQLCDALDAYNSYLDSHNKDEELPPTDSEAAIADAMLTLWQPQVAHRDMSNSSSSEIAAHFSLLDKEDESWRRVPSLLILADNYADATGVLARIERANKYLDFAFQIEATPHTPNLNCSARTIPLYACDTHAKTKHTYQHHVLFCWNLDDCTPYEHSVLLHHLADLADNSLVVCVATRKHPEYSFRKVIDLHTAKGKSNAPPRSPGRPAIEPQAPVYLTTRDVAEKLREHKETTRKRIERDPDFPAPDIQGGKGQSHKWREAAIVAYALKCEKKTADKRQ